MKKISTLLLTLVLSISLLVPEFSMLAYAEDRAPAAAVSEEAAGAETAAQPESPEEAEASGSAEADAAAPEAEAPDAAATEGQSAADSAAPADEIPAADAADPAADDSDASDFEFGSYDKLHMTDLYDANELVISDEVKDKITVSSAENSNGLLFKGTVADLNSALFTISEDFDFDSGSVGRFYFDGLKDKDKGMNVEVEIYLDGSETPAVTIPLKKQMGKKDWANKGDKSSSLGSSEISGKHRVSLRLKITGKKDKSKTSVLLRSMQFCKTTLPVMYFNIDESEGTIEAMNTSSDHSVECYGSVDLIVPDSFNNDKTFRDEYGTQESLTGLDLEYVRGRGNSTWTEEKKPYKVKFDKAQDLFGFGKNKHWVLLANRFDNSLVRNRMTYWLGQQLGMEYTPQCVPVEVVMNGEFYGSYLLCEQIRVGKGRVTIDDLDDQDPLAITDDLIKTGGYLLSMDFEEDEKRSFTTENGMQLYIESPDDNVTYFSDYIKAYTQKVENAIFGDDFKDAAGNPYTDYLDLDSAVDYWWVQEFSANGDAYGSGSTYLYKKRDGEGEPGKLYWGPLWDFDFVAWGDLEYDEDPPSELNYTITPWFEMMKADPAFIAKVKERWTEKGGLKDKLNEITREGGRLDDYIAQMETSYTYDHDLWGSYGSDFTDYKDEIEQLRTWIIKRSEFVDEKVSELSVESHHVKFVVDGKVVKEKDVVGTLRPSDFPEDPEKPGMVFMYWEDSEGIDYAGGSSVTSDLVLTPYFIDESEVIHAENIYFKNYDVYVGLFLDSYDDSDYFTPEYRVMPEGAYETEIKWTSSNEKVAEPDKEFDYIKIKAAGDATITATLSNGVSRSFELHAISYNDFNDWEGISLDRTSLTLKEGEYDQLLATSTPMPCYEPMVIWVSTNEDVAWVDDMGIVTAVGAGTADILAVDTESREIMKCKVTVTPANAKGMTVKYKGSTYKITSDAVGSRTAMLVKAKNAKSVVIPAKIPFAGNKYSVTKIKKKAFAKSKATKLTIKTKKLKKSSVKKALKGSKVKRIKVKVGKKSLNKKYVKKYRKIFTKKNAGRAVKIS